MAFTRTTWGARSRIPGTGVGVQVNTFGLQKLQAAITGEAIADVLLEAMQVAYDQAKEEWPIDTGASGETIRLEKVSSEDLRSHHAGGDPTRVGRVALQIGGLDLINDPRNKSHKDYAPYVEFNGSPAGRGQGVIQRAVYSNQGVILDQVRSGMAGLIYGAAA